MVIFELGQDKRHDMAAHFQIAERVAAEISKTFKPPNELEPEKGEFYTGRVLANAMARARFSSFVSFLWQKLLVRRLPCWSLHSTR